jgi:SAM-dependent methyltransferase
MSDYVQTLSRYFYPDPSALDPVVRLLKEVGGMLQRDSVVLDIGAGAGYLNPYDFKGRCKKIVGVDLDPRVRDNPLLDEGVVHSGDSLPFENGTFDIVFSVYVAEHIEHPLKFLAEVSRVLKPGGVYLQVTPNRLHYVPLIAAVTPHSFHEWLNARRGRDGGDTFPTYYRMNSQKSLAQQAASCGLTVERLSFVECRPNYLLFSWPTFLLGVLYERLVNSTEFFRHFRVNLIATLRKPVAN